MENISVNQFRDKLKNFVDQAIADHEPLKVTRRNGKDFVVISAEDWEREQETLYILQNKNLMKQIAMSIKSHLKNKGYVPSKEVLNEIVNV